MKPIACVCTGNICRSPMAERLLRRELDKAGLHSQEVISAGVAAYDGMPASTYAQQALKEIGIDLSDHRSQLLTKEIINNAGLILVMTQMHKISIQQQFGNISVPIKLWRENMGSSTQVADPYGCDGDIYRACRDSILEAVPGWVEWVKKQG